MRDSNITGAPLVETCRDAVGRGANGTGRSGPDRDPHFEYRSEAIVPGPRRHDHSNFEYCEGVGDPQPLN